MLHAMMELFDRVLETLVERFTPFMSVQVLSKRIKTEEYAFNLILSSLVYIPVMIFLTAAVCQENYGWAFGTVLIMVGTVVLCAIFVWSVVSRRPKRE